MERGRGRGRRRLSGSVARLSHGESPLARETAGTGDTRTATSAHPRWCGEDSCASVRRVVPGGSSPLARGGPPRGFRGRRTPGLIPAGAGRTGTDERDRPTALRLIPAGAGRTCRTRRRPSGCPAHPRWRGEDTQSWPLTPSPSGSSPLARGGRRQWPPRRAAQGLIPAGAGRTGAPSTTGCPRWAHPRWRGEDGLPELTLGYEAGSSPLARGGRRPGPRPPEAQGLIPAGAGRTVISAKSPWPRSAHPRWRGEDDPDAWITRADGGSSPLARGGPVGAPLEADGTRLIPAGAGRTDGPVDECRSAGAHPRWRGEDRNASCGAGTLEGSSPLARGGPRAAPARPRSAGLIPTGAGRTSTSGTRRWWTTAHPRWRGEDSTIRFCACSRVGSSPLARGGLERPGGWFGAAGLIPAGAGRTTSSCRRPGGWAAHPRWRGEDGLHEVLEGGDEGSSPLARGGLYAMRLGPRVVGLIPAGAGRTTN